MLLFHQLKSLSLSSADEIASKAVQIAQRNQFAPISVCVMDPSGHTIVTKRMDGCPPMAFEKMAIAKANTCVAMKLSSRAYGEKYLKSNSGPDVFGRLFSQIAAVEGVAAAFPGGVLIRDKNCPQQSIVGAIGVSGASGAEDEYCALHAVQSSTIGPYVLTEPSSHECTTILVASKQEEEKKED